MHRLKTLACSLGVSLLVVLLRLLPPAALAGAPHEDAPPTWASLGLVRPLLVQTSTPLVGPAITSDPADPRRIAYCAAGTVQLSLDSGASWSAIPTDAVDQAAGASPYPLLPNLQGAPACVSALLDPAHPASLYATFRAGKAPFGAPPIFFSGYVTADGGQSWRPVPAPDGSSDGQFGGFLVDGRRVKALYGTAADFSVEASDDGGLSWVASVLGCPAAGPCLRWGPAPTGIGSCAMNEHPQLLLRSTDGGRTWQTPTLPSGANACQANALITLSESDLLLVEARAPQPLFRTRDGGLTWDEVAVPALPGNLDRPIFLPGLLLLPGGALLAQGDHFWYLLDGGADAWCAVSGTLLPATQDTLSLIGDQLWWLQGSDSPPGSPLQPKSALLSDLRCAPAG